MFEEKSTEAKSDVIVYKHNRKAVDEKVGLKYSCNIYGEMQKVFWAKTLHNDKSS